MLTFVVEHVLLLTVEILDGEAIHGEIAVFRHPLLDRRERDLEQFRIEPGARLTRLGEQDLHLLAPRVDLVVALILVVPERREVPDLISQLADRIRQLERVQQPLGSQRERPLKRRVLRDPGLELVVRGFPARPVLENVLEVPLEAIRNVVAIVQDRCGWSFGGRGGLHPTIIHVCRTKVLRY